jgi:hypothetical protein
VPSILAQDAYEHVEFIAARDFTWGDKSYTMGDDVPEAKSFGNLESMVRSRRLIPVVDDYDKAPFQFRRTVLTRELALTKLGFNQEMLSNRKAVKASEARSTPKPEEPKTAEQGKKKVGRPRKDATSNEGKRDV